MCLQVSEIFAAGLLQQGQVEAGQQLAAQSEAAHYANVIQASQVSHAELSLRSRNTSRDAAHTRKETCCCVVPPA